MIKIIGVLLNIRFYVAFASALGIGIILPNISLAQIDTAKVRLLHEVKVSGKKASVRNTSSTPTQVISGEALQRLNSFSVADALRYFSGVQLKDYGGIGGLKTVNVRSMGTNQTSVFYDGIQMGNAQNGQVDLGRFSLDNMEEVALYNGQKANIFQPAKSFSATSTIYLQTRKPQFADGRSSNIRLGLKAGSFGLVNPSFLYEQKILDRTSVSLSTEWVNADGQYRYRERNGTFDTTIVRTNTDLNAYRIEAGLNGTLKDSASWTLKAYGYSSERGLPGAVVSNKYDFTQRQWDRNIFVQGHFETAESKGYALMINAKYANDYMRYLDPDFVTLDGFLDNRYHQQEIYASAANRYRILPVWNVSFSADYQWNKLNANLYRFPYPTRQTVLAALASEFKLDNFNLQASLLGTFVFDKVREYTSAGNKQEFTPTVMAGYYPFGSKDFMLRAFYKNIFRLPTFNDLYYTFIGNSLLRPEFTNQYDFGATYNIQPLNTALTSISIQADLYYNQVKDKIVAIPSSNLYRWTMYNIGKVAVKGAEVNIQSAWAIAAQLSLNAGLSYSYQQARDVTEGDIYPYNIPYIPLHSGSLILGADWKKFELNYSYIYAGERYNQISTSQSAVYNRMDPWYTHDVGLGYHLDLFGRKAKINLEINNIFNQARWIIANFPMPMRFYRFKFNYTI
ncbi:TonB-dependent receptor plug domain-containing protein [Pedobacter miscanthi]|uniref:TonB-dependent receptor n=1 Tax=Pedobacter miscanthi TaxID=2259170 RepID=A0A366KNW6_9SPHI|nr:TonB-dependent receptor [Pedobacter miscanthi]RBQ03220.1 TonB-dependent receptor [Pedobacter miscanthi]